MPGVFLNYRVGDGEPYAVLLDNALIDQFGSHNVFRASRSIRAGADFHDQISIKISQCSVMVAIIGPRWLTDRDGRCRIQEDGDWVRRELAEAISRGIPVIPVLVADAPPTIDSDLPNDIKQLARFQYLRLHYRSAHIDVPR